jgi:hypothetical protein
MRRVFVVTLLIGALGIATLAAVAPTRKMAVVRFMRPTVIAGAAVLGAVVFEHDDGRMARGEPCTTVYRYNPKLKAPGEVIVEFMCTPHERPITEEFSATCDRRALAGPDRLVEYQFAGDSEGHGVPYWKE